MDCNKHTHDLPVKVPLNHPAVKKLRSLIDHNRLTDLCRTWDDGTATCCCSLPSIKVDMHESRVVSPGVNFKEIILLLLETWNFVKERRLRERPRCIVAPAMIPTTQNHRRALGLLRDRIGPMATDVVKGANPPVLSENQEDTEARDLCREIVAQFHEAAAVADADPCLPYNMPG